MKYIIQGTESGNYKGKKMKKYNVGEYDFENLAKRAITEKSEDAINDLAEWFVRYDLNSWNGENYTFKMNGRKWHLTPVYEEVEEDSFEIVGWELEEMMKVKELFVDKTQMNRQKNKLMPITELLPDMS